MSRFNIIRNKKADTNRMAKGKATMRDVSEYTGLSVATVSRVFTEGASVSYKTRKRVVDAAKTLQFSPNIAARNLATSKSYSISLVMHEAPMTYYFSDLLTGAMNKALRQGYNIVPQYCGRDPKHVTKLYLDKIENHEYGGIILTEWVCTYKNLLNQIKKSQIPCVCIASEPFDKTIPYVCIDDYQASLEIVSYLIKLGHKNIGYIGGEKIASCSHLRLEGYKAALAKYGLKINRRYIREGDFLISGGYRSARKLLSLKQPPTAICASNDPMAAGAIQAAVELYFRVPKDLSVVGFDDVAQTEIVWPTLTTVNQSVGSQGEAAVDLLIQLIENPESFGQNRLIKKVVDHKLMIRNSTAIPRG